MTRHIPRPILVLAVALCGAITSPLAAQARPFLAGAAGVGLDLNDQDGQGGADFGASAILGVRLATVSFGGEWAEISYGGDRKARVLGGFLRAHAFAGPQVAPYLVLGLGGYRFTPSGGGTSTAVGGSFGPGALFRLGERGRVRLLLEARFHTTFEKYANLTRQEFLSAMAGLQFGL